MVYVRRGLIVALSSNAPVDPRATWGLPALGELPRHCALDELVVRVIAPNSTPMTLDGTNTYVVSAPGAGGGMIVDPGPDDVDHLAAIQKVVAERDVQIDAIFVTHHHLDHSEAAQAWAGAFDCPVVAGDRRVAGEHDRLATDGDRLTLAGGLAAHVVATPGHTHDHLALRLPNDMLLTGDHILGRGTTVVTYPDGDMTAYFASLRKTLDVGAASLLPGHGPELTHDTDAVVRYYLDHRTFRLQQIVDVLTASRATVDVLVEKIYPELSPDLRAPAVASTRAALGGLVTRGTVRLCDEATPPDGPYELTGRHSSIEM